MQTPFPPQTKKAAISVRQPPLRLVYPTPNLDRLEAITEEHPLYPIAAFAYHLAVTEPVREGLLAALALAWPRRRGRPRGVAGLYAYLATACGASVKDAAAAFGIGEDGVGKRVARFRAHQTAVHNHLETGAGIVVVTGEEALHLLGVSDPDLIASEPLELSELQRQRAAAARVAEQAAHRQEGARQRAAVKSAADRLLEGNPQIAADALAHELAPEDILHFHHSADGAVELVGTGADEEFNRRRTAYFRQFVRRSRAPSDPPPPRARHH
jgi:hypothetical protein